MIFRDVDVEHRVLIACALAPTGLDLSSALARASGNALSWDRLLKSAAVNQVRPQVATCLREIPLHIPAARRAKVDLDAILHANHGHGLFMAGELITVLDALRAADIPAVPFKGPAFATLMGSGPGLREMGDLDLLIDPRNILESVKALAPLGYEAMLPPHVLASPWLPRVTPELPLVRQRDSMMLELHWRLGQEWYPVPCRAEDILPRLGERDFFGSRIPWPAAEELFLIHVADGMKSCGCGIRWVADVVQILRRHANLDWDQVRRIAKRSGGLNNIRVALAVAEDLSGDIARLLDVPALALDLPASARALAEEARRRNRLVRAVQSIGERIRTDTWVARAAAHFRWALQVADHPGRTAGAIIRYLAGPAVADLGAMPSQGESGVALRLRAVRRRLASAAG